MHWLKKILGKPESVSEIDPGTVQKKFRQFRALLTAHDHVMHIAGDMEEKAQGEYLFDLHYLRSNLAKLHAAVTEAIDLMLAMGGDQYRPLHKQREEIFRKIEQIIPLSRAIEEDEYTISFDRLDRDRAMSVGSKNAQLGEMKSKLGLPVPEGFALSAWAYKQFIDRNNLQDLINREINDLNIRSYDELTRRSERILAGFLAGRIPEEIIEASLASLEEITRKYPTDRFAMRSSAIGEDTLYSFAGQYASLLNVKREDLVHAYREVLASKFNPQAIYYFLSHAMAESELAMSVGCVVMIDAVASGVVYSRNPISPDDDNIVISSIWGLGKYLVDGRLTPDTFSVSRRDGTLKQVILANKEVRLGLAVDGGTREEQVEPELQHKPSITEAQIQELTRYAIQLEEHYETPQDIEFAIDREGTLFLLQTRPLRIASPPRAEVEIDRSRIPKLSDGGVTVSHGVGAGQICLVRSQKDLQKVSDGCVLVTPNPFPGIITAMTRVRAIITRVGGVANHMATIAREYRIPTLGGYHSIDDLTEGELVTVDATGCTVYEGLQRELIDWRKQDHDLFSDIVIFELLKRVLQWISPLNLLHPHSPRFTIENCRTIHDITRFIHQRAIEEMFSEALASGDRHRADLRLKTDMPLRVRLLYLEPSPTNRAVKGEIPLERLGSIPMIEFWRGVAREGWPKAAPPPEAISMKGTTVARSGRRKVFRYRETSFAIIGREYMLCNLHMGYHFTTVEALCTNDPGKNYIRMQCGEGGASLEKRVRRINLIAAVAEHIGFENYSQGDFLNVSLSYHNEDEIREKLYLLGQLTMMIKQLDMALTNDDVAEWYRMDIMKRLELLDPDDKEV